MFIKIHVYVFYIHVLQADILVSYMYYTQHLLREKNKSVTIRDKKTNAIKNVVLMQWSLKVCGLNAGNTVIRFRSFSSMKYMYLLLG